MRKSNYIKEFNETASMDNNDAFCKIENQKRKVRKTKIINKIFLTNGAKTQCQLSNVIIV